jgi:hypothetical protein
MSPTITNAGSADWNGLSGLSDEQTAMVSPSEILAPKNDHVLAAIRFCPDAAGAALSRILGTQVHRRVIPQNEKRCGSL